MPWTTDADGGQALAEFAGRACYQSWSKPIPTTATNAGYLDHITVAQDVCLKIQLKAYGGFGFDHIVESAIPMWRSVGLDETEIRRILVENPARVLGGAT